LEIPCSVARIQELTVEFPTWLNEHCLNRELLSQFPLPLIAEVREGEHGKTPYDSPIQQLAGDHPGRRQCVELIESLCGGKRLRRPTGCGFPFAIFLYFTKKAVEVDTTSGPGFGFEHFKRPLYRSRVSQR